MVFDFFDLSMIIFTHMRCNVCLYLTSPLAQFAALCSALGVLGSFPATGLCITYLFTLFFSTRLNTIFRFPVVADAMVVTHKYRGFKNNNRSKSRRLKSFHSDRESLKSHTYIYLHNYITYYLNKKSMYQYRPA